MAENKKDSEGDKSETLSDKNNPYDAIIIGAGAAGVGVAIALVNAGIQNYLIIERNTVGSSFASWPDETRFITPSFPSNSIGMLDLNSIAIGVSPAYSMRIEHPTGIEYAKHLQDLAKFFELKISNNTNVISIDKNEERFFIKTDSKTFYSKNVIWAAGEYQSPSINVFPGSELCRHTSTVSKYGDLEGDDFLIVGGYESGIDAAYHLAKQNKKVRVFDMNCPWGELSSDPSVALSTYSFERVRDESFENNVELFSETKVKSVTLLEETYELRTEEGQLFKSMVKPLLASGFEGSHKFVSHLFEQRDDGFPKLNENDESTIVPNMYLCGPSVRHDNHIFCFIYKFRQRFAIVAKDIASSLNLPTEEFVEAYKSWGMYLDDLSCCGQECLTC